MYRNACMRNKLITHRAGAVGSTVERGGALRPVGGGKREARRERCCEQHQGLGHLCGHQCRGWGV